MGARSKAVPGGRRAAAAGLVALLVVLPMAVVTAPSASAATTTIVVRPGATTTSWPNDSTSSLVVTAPSTAVDGDLLVASLSIGRSRARTPTAVAAPAGWTLVGRTDLGASQSTALYRHVFAPSEQHYTFTAGAPVGGFAIVAAFGGVDRNAPVDVTAGRTTTKRSTDVTTPSVTTSGAGELLVAGFLGISGGASTTWRPPPGMDQAAQATSSAGARSGSLATSVQVAGGAAGSRTATASTRQDSAIAVLLALRPATFGPPPPPPPTGPVRLIVDTDLYSDADDVGALATAFALQAKGEAQVLAIGLNTRTDRPAVTTDSWRCAAAVAQFYGQGSVPIASSFPTNGTSTNTVDFVGPCARLAAPGTPAPSSAVATFRKVLAAQPDHSVVVVETGYSGNLAALLASPADATSPLSGRDLIAAKVQRLEVMGGGYPSRAGENNLAGDPVAAQAVATRWPSPITWDGYEVGDQIHTGSTISATHPATSPVRVAYEAFVAPGNWIYSYDLVATYHAVRPDDPALTQSALGTNVVTSTGGNRFTVGSGSQSYLLLHDAAGLGRSIDALLQLVPTTTPPPPTSSTGPSDTFDSNTIDPTVWTTSAAGSTVAATGQELQIAHPAGAWTRGTLASRNAYDQTGHATQVQVKRPADGASGGTTYGETSVSLAADPTHQATFFFAGGALTAWTDVGGTEVNLTPSWPRYDPVATQWVRFREAGGTLVFEYAAGATAPGPWTVLASTPDPFALTSVHLQVTAGTNAAAADVSRFDNVSTS